MIETLSADCPICGSPLNFDVRQRLSIKNKLVVEHLEMRHVRRKKIEPVSARELQIIEAIEPYLQEDTTIECLQMVLLNEFGVCKIHLDQITDKIKEAYRLYSPDGKRLRPI
jgi:hypothetical protein